MNAIGACRAVEPIRQKYPIPETGNPKPSGHDDRVGNL